LRRVAALRALNRPTAFFPRPAGITAAAGGGLLMPGRIERRDPWTEHDLSANRLRAKTMLASVGWFFQIIAQSPEITLGINYLPIS
jgi:hypothetical protein